MSQHHDVGAVDPLDIIEFDDLVTLALAQSAEGAEPRPALKRELLARVAEPAIPAGFAFKMAKDRDWVPHPVPGIMMKMLSMNKASGYATFLLDVQPGTHFPKHFHDGAEECYVISGSLYTCDRRLDAGDFVHADANTDHDELWTEEGCRVLIVQQPEEYMPGFTA